MPTPTMSNPDAMYRQRPPPVPFNGQPPPMPQNLVQAVPANLWASGTWQPNPQYNPAAARMFNNNAPQQVPFVQWVPAQTWAMVRAQAAAQHQQQHQQQSYNPYRKQVKAPSAEYLASSLSANPLGLENMDPSKSLYNNIPPEPIAGLDDGGANKHTPWIWRPKVLEEEPLAHHDASSSEEDDTDDDEPPPPKAIPPRESFTSPGPLQPTFSPNIVRTPEHYRAGSTSIESRMQNLHVNSTPTRQPLTRHSSMPTTSISGVHSLSDEPVSMLSPLIISNTPKPSTNTRQLAAAAAAAAAASTTLSRHATAPVLSTIPEGPANSRTATQPAPSSSASAYAAASHRRQSHDPQQQQSSRSSSRQPSPSTPPNTHRPRTPPHYGYSAPPAAVGSYPPRWRDQQPQQTQYQTPPNSASAAPAGYFQQQQNPCSLTPTPTSRKSSRDRTTSSDRLPPPPAPGCSYPVYMSGPPSMAPPPIQHFPSANPYPTPPSGSIGSSPSKVVANTNAPSYSPKDTSGYYQQHPGYVSQQSHPYQRGASTPITSTPPTSRRGSAAIIIPPGRRRKGYWNRRGDHLTASGYVVYAPPHQAYPPDLADYPKEYDSRTDSPGSSSSSSSDSSSNSPSNLADQTSQWKRKGKSGYLDDNGIFAPWIKRPELPESLPRHGREPEMPYDRFVEYI